MGCRGREEAGWTAERSESLASSEKRFQTRPPPATRFLSHLKGGMRRQGGSVNCRSPPAAAAAAIAARRPQTAGQQNASPPIRRRLGRGGRRVDVCVWEGGGVGRSVYTVPFISLSSSLIPSCFASHRVIRPPDSLPRFDRCC